MRRHTFFLLGFLLLPAIAFAADTGFVPLTTLPGIKEFVTSASLPDLLGNIYRICIGVAATLAVLQIMFAGVQYMGGDSVTEKKDARQRITLSIVGLLLVLSPTIVFSIINPDILKLDIGADRLKLPDGAGNVSTVPPDTASSCGEKYQPIASLQDTNSCEAAGEGFVSIESACCDGMDSSSICCGKPK